MTKLICSEWTPEELAMRVKCYCECHQYPTTLERPCTACGHVNELGYHPWGPSSFGWVEYYVFNREALK